MIGQDPCIGTGLVPSKKKESSSSLCAFTLTRLVSNRGKLIFIVAIRSLHPSLCLNHLNQLHSPGTISACLLFRCIVRAYATVATRSSLLAHRNRAVVLWRNCSKSIKLQASCGYHFGIATAAKNLIGFEIDSVSNLFQKNNHFAKDQTMVQDRMSE